MTLPQIFAIYQKDTNTFVLLQSDLTLYGSKYRFKLWNRPVKTCWSTYTQEEKHSVVPWFKGEQWFVVKDTTLVHGIRTINLLEREYTYWYLGHTLVWSSSTDPLTVSSIMKCPSIPILEFNARTIFHPKMTGFRANWYDTTPTILESISSVYWDTVYRRIKEKEVGVGKHMRIRTPTPKDDATSDTVSANTDIDTDTTKDCISITVQPKTPCCVSKPLEFLTECGGCCCTIVWAMCVGISLCNILFGL